MSGGLYIIWLSETHYYGGRTSDFRKRWNVHKAKLNSGKHNNPWMQAVYNKYRRFEPEIVSEIIDLEAQLEAEQEWLLGNLGALGCLNLSGRAEGGRRKGVKHSAEARAKMKASAALRPPVSIETREKMSRARRGVKRPGVGEGRSLSEEHKEKLAVSNRGQKRSSESRERMSAVRRGVKLSESHREALSKVRAGKIWIVCRDGTTKLIQPCELESHAEQGWRRGRVFEEKPCR